MDEPDHDRNPVEESEEGLSWVTVLGALSGLIVGVVVAMLISAGLHRADPDSSFAEVFWEIASPLLGISGVILGVLLYHRTLRKRALLALAITLALTALGLYLAFGPVGFEWRQ